MQAQDAFDGAYQGSLRSNDISRDDYAGHPFASSGDPLSYQQLYTTSNPPFTTRSRAASTSSSILSASSASTSFSHSSGYGSPLSTSEGFAPRLLAGDAAGFAVQLPGGEQWMVPWGELVGLLADPQTTVILPETHLIKRLAGFLTSAQEPMIAPRPSSYIQKPSLNGVTSNLHSLSVRHSQPYPPHSRIPRRATPPQQSLPPPPEQSATQSFIYSASPSSAPSIASFATYPPPSTRLDPPLRSSSYFTPLQQAFLASISHPSTPSASALRTSSAHRDREAQREQSRPYPRPSSQHSMHSPTTELNDHRSHSRPPSQYSSHSNSSSEYHDFPPEPRVLRPVNSTAEHYLWNAHLGLLYRLGADFDTRTSLDGQTVISFPPGSYHKVVKEDLEILPSDGKAINEWLRGQECVGSCRFRFEKKRPATIRAHVVNCKARARLSVDPIKQLCELQNLAQSSKSRGYQSSIMFIPGEGSGDWNDSQSLSDSASTHQIKPGEEGGDLPYCDAPTQLKTEFMQQDGPSEHALHALITSSSSSSSSEWDPWLAEYGLEAPNGERASALPDEPTQHSGSFLSMDEE